MLFYYVQIVQIKDRHDPKSKHQSKNKRSKHQRSKGLWAGWGDLRKLLGSKDYQDWLKIDLNAAKIITVQDYKHRKLM